MFRKSLTALAVLGSTLSLTVGPGAAAQEAPQQLSPVEVYVLTGVYDEMKTCFGWVALAGAYAKSKDDTEALNHYQEQGIVFMKGYEFFGDAVGKDSKVIAQEVSDTMMTMHAQTDGLAKITPLKLAHEARCNVVAENPKVIMDDYIAKYGGE